jgi:hypothetical protein
MKNIIITEKQLEKLVDKMKENITETHQHGSYMAKSQLYTIATLAYKMWEELDEKENRGEEIHLEDWMESKIAQSEQSIISVVKTFMYDEKVEEDKLPMDGMNKLGYDDLVIGN